MEEDTNLLLYLQQVLGTVGGLEIKFLNLRQVIIGGIHRKTLIA